MQQFLKIKLIKLKNLKLILLQQWDFYNYNIIIDEIKCVEYLKSKNQ
jgi:hypothetical protein